MIDGQVFPIKNISSHPIPCFVTAPSLSSPSETSVLKELPVLGVSATSPHTHYWAHCYVDAALITFYKKTQWTFSGFVFVLAFYVLTAALFYKKTSSLPSLMSSSFSASLTCLGSFSGFHPRPSSLGIYRFFLEMPSSPELESHSHCVANTRVCLFTSNLSPELQTSIVHLY